MKKDQVHIGRTYLAKVSGQLAQVRIDAESGLGGWSATNVATHRKVRIKSAQRLRREVRQEDDDHIAVAAADQENARLQEERAQSPDGQTASERAMADSSKRYDPDRCATPRCKGEPALTHLGKPLCQKCWEHHCREEEPTEVSETAGDACRPTEDQEPNEEEIAMSKKKTTKKQTAKKQTKAQPAAKAKGAKKAAKPKAAAEQKPKRVSALDAAAQVLKSAGKPMRAQELIVAMAEKNLWSSPNGKTPHATLCAAMQREERDKGRESRFKKVERGLFQFNKAGA